MKGVAGDLHPTSLSSWGRILVPPGAPGVTALVAELRRLRPSLQPPGHCYPQAWAWTGSEGPSFLLAALTFQAFPSMGTPQMDMVCLAASPTNLLRSGVLEAEL